jgi:hypothetical protein
MGLKIVRKQRFTIFWNGLENRETLFPGPENDTDGTWYIKNRVVAWKINHLYFEHSLYNFSRHIFSYEGFYLEQNYFLRYFS